MASLLERRLYLCVGLRDDLATFLPAVLEGGVDVVQLREKLRPRQDQIAPAREMVAICRDYGVPFIMNDDPTLALDVGADGVHVGQDDLSVDDCRAILGPDAIVGLSTHADEEFTAGLREAATYLSAGPIEPTPTKLGRAGTGLSYAQRCVTRSDRPVYVTGGVNETNVARLVDAGLRHFVVVRALTEAADPGQRARSIRAALDDALSAVSI